MSGDTIKKLTNINSDFAYILNDMTNSFERELLRGISLMLTALIERLGGDV